MKLKIFTNFQYLPPKAFPLNLLKPFWLQNSTSNLTPWSSGISDYANISHSIFEITSLEEADFAILPFDWLYVRGSTWKPQINLEAMRLGIEFAQIVKQANKPLIIFFTNDSSHEEIPIKDAFVFRQSLLASTRRTSDFALNAVYEDLVKCYRGSEISIRHKQDKPVIGFTGFANKLSWNNKLKEFIYQIAMLPKGGAKYSPYQGHHIRSKALNYLSNSQKIETNFVIRDKMVFFDEAIDVEQKLRLRIEYVNSMVDSDYILCCRGRGNFSFRLFEALCCGRIPIFINTNCVLPFDFAIDWKKYCVWVESKELPQIAEKVIDFHNNLSPQEFIDLQHQCRSLWKEMLSTEGFFTNFWRHFQSQVAEKMLSSV
jgi:Exostosin family